MTNPLVETGGRAQVKNVLRGVRWLTLFIPLVLSFGCAGLVSNSSKTSQTTNPNPSSQSTYNVSGTISPTAGGSGATLTLSGAATANTTANSSGAYTFSGLANGTYAVTPSRTGYGFSPTSQSVVVNGSDVTGVNFTASVQNGQTYSISGTITPTAGGSGAIVALSGAAIGSTATNGSGAYTFSGLVNGSYTITPVNSGYAFSPTNKSVTVSGASVSGVNFSASVAQTHSATTSWTAPTIPGGGAPIAGYNVYRGTVNGGPYAKLNTSLITVLAYTDSTVQATNTYYYVATSVDTSGNESVFSMQATATIP